MKTLRNTIPFGLLIISLLTTMGCGGAEENKLNLFVYTPVDATANPYSGVSWLRITAVGDDLNQVDYSRYVALNDGVAALSGTPFGYRQIMVTGHPASPTTGKPVSNVVLSRGATPYMDISSGSSAQDLPVFLAPADSYVLTAKAPATAGPGAFPTGITSSRVGHTLTALSDGRVLVAGGAFLQSATAFWHEYQGLDVNTFRKSLEVFDSKDGSFSTSGSNVNNQLASGRAFHASVVLSDGRVAFLGGVSNVNGVIQPVASVEIFDPANGVVEYREDLNLGLPRALHTATPIPNTTDEFLIVGGSGVAAPTWCIWSAQYGITATGSLSQARWGHTATSVDQGTIFIIGGENDTGLAGSIEIFQSASRTFETQTVALSTPRSRHTASYVPSRGFIYLVGGFSDTEHTSVINLVDVLGVSDRQFKVQNFALTNARAGHSAAVIGNSVVISGGMILSGNAYTPTSSGEIIFEHKDIATNQVTIKIGETAPVPDARGLHQAIALDTGMVLVIGGASVTNNFFSGPLSGVLYNP